METKINLGGVELNYDSDLTLSPEKISELQQSFAESLTATYKKQLEVKEREALNDKYEAIRKVIDSDQVKNNSELIEALFNVLFVDDSGAKEELLEKEGPDNGDSVEETVPEIITLIRNKINEKEFCMEVEKALKIAAILCPVPKSLFVGIIRHFGNKKYVTWQEVPFSSVKDSKLTCFASSAGLRFTVTLDSEYEGFITNGPDKVVVSPDLKRVKEYLEYEE